MADNRTRLSCIFNALVLATVLPVPAVRTSTDIPKAAQDAQVRAHARAASATLPMRFERNLGRVPSGADFIARGAGYVVYVSGRRTTLILKSSSANTAVEVAMRLEGARHPTAVAGLDGLPGVTNHLIGNDPRQWQTGIRGYAKIQYRDVYPGVNVVYYGSQQQLEYDFVVAPGAKYSNIALSFEDTKGLRLDDHGNLVIATELGELIQHAPIMYQEKDGARQSVEGGYVIRQGHRVGFRVTRFDRRRPLIIDPVLTYSTYLGGTAGEAASGVAVDAQGNMYLAGQTTSLNFPQVNAAQPALGGGSLDAFVAKLNPAGNALIYATYLGGSGYEYAKDIAVDQDGNAYVTGSTVSHDFPTVHALQSTLKGYSDSFVTKLDPTGVIVYSTLLGGHGEDYGYGIAVDASGRAYVTGQTISSDFPTAKPQQATLGGAVAYKTIDGGRTWAALRSGLSTTNVSSFAVDPVNPATVYAGSYNDGLFRSVDGGQTWALNAEIPGVLAVAIDPLTSSTIYAGSGFSVWRSRDGGASWRVVGPYAEVTALAIDPVTPMTIYAGASVSGSYSRIFKSTNGGDTWAGIPTGPYVWSLGVSKSSPSTIYAGTDNGVFKSTAGGFDGFLPVNTGLPRGAVYSLAVDPTNASIAYAATNLGLFRTDSGGGQWVPVSPLSGIQTIAVAIAPSAPSTVYAESYASGGVVSNDAGASWTVIGPASQSSFRLAIDPTLPTTAYVGAIVAWDAFVARLSPDGSSLEYSTYLGGSGFDYGNDVTVDSSGNAYIVGATASADFPTLNAAQTMFGGIRDLFVAKLSPSGTLVYATYLGGSAWEDGGTIGVDAAGQAHVGGYTLSPDFPTVRAQQTVFGGGGSDAFVTKLDSTGSVILYSTFLGGSGSEMGPASQEVGRDPVVSIAVAASGDVFVTGVTSSTDFPTVRALQAAHAGGVYDAFVAKLAPDGLLQFSTFLGGSGADAGRRIAVDSSGALIVAGVTGSTDFPSQNPLQAVNAGSDDSFIVRITDALDPTPPTTTISQSGTPGLAGWYRSSVAVTLAATDPQGESGVAFVDYRINDGGFQRYAVPFTISAEGVTQVYGRATDHSGNVENPPTSAVLMIDMAAPAVVISSPQARDYLHSEALTLGFSATDSTSGLGVGNPSATVDGSSSANGQTIQLLTLPLGTHTLSVVASDVAGNTSQQSQSFRVIATIDSLIASVNAFAAQGKIDPSTQKSLLVKLNDAKTALGRANLATVRAKLNEFIDQCNVKSGKTIAPDAANMLVMDAQYVLSAI